MSSNVPISLCDELLRRAVSARDSAHPKNRGDVCITVLAQAIIELCESHAYWKDRALMLESDSA